MISDLTNAIGFKNGRSQDLPVEDLLRHANLKLLSYGYRPYVGEGDGRFLREAEGFLGHVRERFLPSEPRLSPVDQRIQEFLVTNLRDTTVADRVKLPVRTLEMDRYGLARMLSLPPDSNEYRSERLTSHRILQGVLHNPASDRRTTQGSFHVSEGGLPIQDDKLCVPKETFARMLVEAFLPPDEDLELPFCSTSEQKVRIFTTLHLHPVVLPEVPGVMPGRKMEIRFFVPGSLIANLDFVESIFGNAGDPYLPENDLALDPEHFTGHSGCVILAPHLTRLRKKDLGLPHVSKATERQKAHGMCWQNEDEPYHGGNPFKLTFRNDEGVMVTLIADNYFGYCKKEVKTQIGYSANLSGLVEEEHAGGAIVFPSYNLGDHFKRDIHGDIDHTFEDTCRCLGEAIERRPEGYAVDRLHREIVYLPEDAEFHLHQQRISWKIGERESALKLLPNHVYVYPSGYKVRLEKHPDAPSWRLVGTVAEGTFCHKPCTVSGGGKSEISKSIEDSIIYKSFYVGDFQRAREQVREILEKDYGNRFRIKWDGKTKASRKILDPSRSLGSVVKLLTPSPEYNDEFNSWLDGIPHDVRAFVFAIKRFYRTEWGSDFVSHFSVDVMDGKLGHELNLDHRKLLSSYLRVGSDSKGNWRVYRLRLDYIPSYKLQMEDDISASIVLPSGSLEQMNPDYNHESYKFVRNCEFRLFQRPDDAVHRGYDEQAESDLAAPNSFLSNFEPLSPDVAVEMLENTIEFNKFTEPMQNLIRKAATLGKGEFFCCSASPRIVDGMPSKNPRYLQNRPDLVNPRDAYVAEVGTRLRRRLEPGRPILNPVNAVLIGRRNNPPDHAAGIKPLAVYNPLHYQELPELFMDLIASLSGKSPSTTGAGSEGALTKGPFNSLRTITDLNNALVSYILTGYQAYSTPAGHIGHEFKVDHDLSLLIPELWSRLSPRERDANFLIKAGCLEKLEDFDFQGRRIEASRLGYRINETFLHRYMGRIFISPTLVFPAEMLQPEKQGLSDFADGVEHITEAQTRIAQTFLSDGSVEGACPPLEALLHIMAEGSWNGWALSSPEFRMLFSAESMLESDWYRKRLKMLQARETRMWRRHATHLRSFMAKSFNQETVKRMNLNARLERVEERLQAVSEPDYPGQLVGTLGADPLGAY